MFDPQIVARRDATQDWETMLETAVLSWMSCVVAERRTGK